MTKKEVYLFFKFTLWGWIAILIFLATLTFSYLQYKLCSYYFKDYINIWKIIFIIEVVIEVIAEILNMPGVFIRYKKRRMQYDKLCSLYTQYDKIPKSVVYSMKTTNCEKIVVNQFLKDMKAKLD